MSVNIKKNGTLIKLAGLYANINLRLSQLLDTDISSLEDGQILAYNNETSKWENQEAPAGVEVVDNLTTQSATSALSANQGYVLNNALAGKANTADVLPTLITNPANKQILSYDSSSSKWVNSVNGNTVLLGTADPAANLGKEGDLYVKLSSPSYGSSYRIYTTGTGGETANITVQTIVNGAVTNSDTIYYRTPNRTYPDFTTNYKSSNWTITITSDNVYGREKGSTISWPYYQTNDVTLTINPPSVHGIFVKSRGIWIQIGKSPVENFSELKDTNFNNLQDGQLTVYNSTTGKWENQNLPSSTDLFTITLTSSEDPETGETIYTANKLPSEVIAAYNNGDVVQLVMSSGNLPYYFTLGNAVISEDESESETGFMFQRLFVYDNDEAAFGEFILVKEQNVNAWDYIEFIHNFLAVGGNSLVAEITENNNVYTCDKTFEEVNDAYYGSKDIFIKFGSRIFKIARYESSTNTFYFTSTIANANRTDVKTFVMTGSYTTENWTSITLTESSGGDPNVIKWSDAETSVKKNWLNLSSATQTVNGVTFTVNADGTITVNGTASAITQISVNDTNRFTNLGSYILSGCPSGGGNTTFDLRTDSNVDESSDKIDTGNGIAFSKSTNSGTRIIITIRSGYVANNLVFRPMIRLASIKDNTYVPYIPDNTELLSYADNNVLGAKNLLPANITNRTNAGITVTVNSDGGINVSGTATEVMSIDVCNYFKLPLGDYILTGTPYGGSQAQFKLLLVRDGSGIGDDIGNGYRFSVTSASANYRVQIRIPSEMVGVAGNKTFYPMIRLASDTDNTYAPYSKTNIELTNSVAWETENILGAKNLLPNCLPPTSFTKNGITFTKNSDGSITCEGVATDDMWVGLYKYSSIGNSASGDCFLKEGKYTLSGCPTGGGTTAGTYRMYFQVRNSTDTGEEVAFSDLGNSVTFDITSTYASRKCRVIIAIRSGCDLTTPVTFYPMIRYASIMDTTYEPYSMSNIELTDEVEKSYGRTYTLYMAGDSSKDMDTYAKSLGITPTMTLRQMCELLSATERNKSIRVIINTNNSTVSSDSIQVLKDVCAAVDKFATPIVRFIIDVVSVDNGRLFISRIDKDLKDVRYASLQNWEVIKRITTPLEFYLDQTATTSTTTDTVYTFTDSNIFAASVIDVYTNIFGVNPSNIQVVDGSCTVTFPKQATAQSMTCRIYIK